MDEQLVKLYADFAVKSAVNLQKGQTLIINSPVESAAFAELCATSAYDAGAREVVVHFSDERLGRIRMERTDIRVLEDVKPWRLRSYLEYAEGEGGTSVLSISSRDPEIYKGLDVGKVNKANQAASLAMRPWWEMTMANEVQWSVLAVPSKAWATRVFPALQPQEAIEKLWDAVFKVCRVDTGDPCGAWEKHVQQIAQRRDWLQSLSLTGLHFQSGNGTDLAVGLAEDNIWVGAQDCSRKSIPFLANVPTEEIFTAPHRERVEGVVKSSLPYVYNGNLIEGIAVQFEEGVAVKAQAEKGDGLLQQMLGVDEGARHLGEIALVPMTNPVRQTGVLFYNTLFDENAACHMAFGAGYPTNLENSEILDRRQMEARGLNDSLIHEDIMIGTADMRIVGRTQSGQTVEIFKDGDWAQAGV